MQDKIPLEDRLEEAKQKTIRELKPCYVNYLRKKIETINNPSIKDKYKILPIRALGRAVVTLAKKNYYTEYLAHLCLSYINKYEK